MMLLLINTIRHGRLVLPLTRLLRALLCALLLSLLLSPLLNPLLSDALLAAQTPDKHDEDAIRIIESKSRTLYEYRQNGVLIMIKIVPKKGLAYYLVPADQSPHYESLDHKRKLYPQWVIKEW